MALLGFLFIGCSSTHIDTTRNWSVQLGSPFRNILVVAMDERPEMRQRAENDIVRFLQARNVRGTATVGSFTFAEFKGDREQIRQKLAGANGDAVLFVRVADRDTFKDGAVGSLGGYDMGAVSESRYVRLTAGGGEIKSDIQIGARLFRLSDGALIWSGLVDTKIGDNSDSVVVLDNIAKTIVEGMVKDQVIP